MMTEALAAAPALELDNEKIHRLERSFHSFIGVTEQLKGAYERLRLRAEAMDLKLRDANRTLSEKVDELDDLSRRLHGLLQGLPSAVVAVDREGRVIHCNRAAEELLGVDAGEVTGSEVADSEVLAGALVLARTPGRCTAPLEGEERTLLTRDGRRLVVASRLSELTDGEGRSAGRIEILTDLTETDRLRREVHRLDTLTAMGEMAANVAHQIRNPLNGVEGFASLLVRALQARRSDGESDATTEKSLRYGRNIIRGVREVNAIITGMLQLAKPDQLLLKALNLDALVTETAAGVREAQESSGRVVDLEVNPGARGVWITADGFKLKQVLSNLIHNAIEALPAEGRRLVRVTTRRRGDRIVIDVADTGEGLSPDDMGKLFRPFFTTRETGTGLGLAVASHYVELHGGGLRARSRPGRATVFRIALTGCITRKRSEG